MGRSEESSNRRDAGPRLDAPPRKRMGFRRFTDPSIVPARLNRVGACAWVDQSSGGVASGWGGTR
jgi:hypothetical protein